MLELLSWLLSIYSRPTKLHGVCFGDILRFDCSDHFKHMFGLFSWTISIKRWPIQLHRLCLRGVRCTQRFNLMRSLQFWILSTKLRSVNLLELRRWKILERYRGDFVDRLYRLFGWDIFKFFWCRQLYRLFCWDLQRYVRHHMLKLRPWILSVKSRPSKLYGVCFGDLLLFISCGRVYHMHKLQHWIFPA